MLCILVKYREPDVHVFLFKSRDHCHANHWDLTSLGVKVSLLAYFCCHSDEQRPEKCVSVCVCVCVDLTSKGDKDQ